jgi:hypothetical protein
MQVVLPGAGVTWGLEWRVLEGARVASGEVIAWLDRPGECALVALKAPAPGVLTARWSEALPSGPAGAVVAVIDGAADGCRRDEAAALEQQLAVTAARLASFRDGHHPAARTLLEEERTALERRRRALVERLHWLGAPAPRY